MKILQVISFAEIVVLHTEVFKRLKFMFYQFFRSSETAFWKGLKSRCSFKTMPKELLAVGPREPALLEYEERPLKKGEIRIRSIFSAEKHGTTLLLYRGEAPFLNKYYDQERMLFLNRADEKSYFPFPLGNMTVGIVEEVSPEARRFKVGDRVYGYLPIRETHTVYEQNVMPAPEGVSDEELVCVDPAVVALMAVREGHVRLGDKVAIFGMGAIGLLTLQMCKISGSLCVIAVEPVEKKRSLAEKFGADYVIDPTSEDAGTRIRELTNWKGVDVSLEISGSCQALHQAIRATRYGGKVIPVSWYHGEAKSLYLGEEFHFNRITLLSGARVESEPYREHPLWNRERVYATVIELFIRKKISVEGIIDPVVKFSQVVEAYRKMDEQPWECVKLGVTYS
jgi:threonine dehydrogenase-like Zn-dependent dehydrogenase